MSGLIRYVRAENSRRSFLRIGGAAAAGAAGAILGRAGGRQPARFSAGGTGLVERDGLRRC